jgi:hypothetical protein
VAIPQPKPVASTQCDVAISSFVNIPRVIICFYDTKKEGNKRFPLRPLTNPSGLEMALLGCKINKENQFIDFRLITQRGKHTLPSLSSSNSMIL